jgi:hypothetical protein
VIRRQSANLCTFSSPHPGIWLHGDNITAILLSRVQATQGVVQPPKTTLVLLDDLNNVGSTAVRTVMNAENAFGIFRLGFKRAPTRLRGKSSGSELPSFRHLSFECSKRTRADAIDAIDAIDAALATSRCQDLLQQVVPVPSPSSGLSCDCRECRGKAASLPPTPSSVSLVGHDVCGWDALGSVAKVDEILQLVVDKAHTRGWALHVRCVRCVRCARCVRMFRRIYWPWHTHYQNW